MSGGWCFEASNTHSYAYWQAFSPEECEVIKQIGLAKTVSDGTISVNKQSILNAEIRESNVSWIFPDQESEWLFRKVTDVVTNLNSQFFNFDLFGLIEGFQFTEYNAPSGHYGKHIDITNQGSVRKLSFTLQLTDPSEYEGGELCLYLGGDPIVISREQGYVCVFPSYVLHEVKPVTKGTRHSLVSWVSGKPFR